MRSPVLASDQSILEIPSDISELRTVLLCLLAGCCCMNGLVLSSAMVTQDVTGTQGGTISPGLPCQAQGTFQGGARPKQGHTGVP